MGLETQPFGLNLWNLRSSNLILLGSDRRDTVSTGITFINGNEGDFKDIILLELLHPFSYVLLFLVEVLFLNGQDKEEEEAAVPLRLIQILRVSDLKGDY